MTDATLRISREGQYYIEKRCTIYDDDEAKRRGFRSGDIYVPIPESIARQWLPAPVPREIDMGMAEFQELQERFGELPFREATG